MSIMIITHNLIGWYEVISKNYLFLQDETVLTYTYYSQPVSMFGNVNDFATFLLFAVFIEFICASNSINSLVKLVHNLVLVSSIVLLIYTGSRAAFFWFAYWRDIF